MIHIKETGRGSTLSGYSYSLEPQDVFTDSSHPESFQYSLEYQWQC